MIIQNRKLRQRALVVAVAAAIGMAASTSTQAWVSPAPHVFSISDIQGDFQGSTYATDPSIICGLGTTACPADVAPLLDKSGVTLYPIDSEFGFYIVDFLGAAQKFRDGNYLEGYAGNIPTGGIRISDYATDTYKVKPPYGTWCRGLGGNTVKCETEHYTTMEHVLSCHEVIPYMYADPVTGEQEVQSFLDLIPDDYPNEPPYELPAESSFDCAKAGLDDAVYVVSGGVVTNTLLTSNLSVAQGGQMDANDLTTVLDNFAVSSDYSITLKDDGKPDYHWGTIIKRPNDVRMYARMDVPTDWTAATAPATGYKVTKARLIVNHAITNNPNDQLRPEDIENEAATGRKPSYEVVTVTPDPAAPNQTATTVQKSTVPCYEGDSDVIETEEGSIDPTYIGPGTYLKNTPWSYTGVQVPDPLNCVEGDNCNNPQPISADLTGGLTNAYYTTINRDPFEWSYLPVVRDPNVFNFVGCAGPADDPTYAGTCKDSFGVTYTVDQLAPVTGPRWRLKPNKFGQDLPGLEIPLVECSPPPFERDNIKYNVGDPTVTVINLLDWVDTNANGIQDDSPLANSKGWVDTTVVPSVDGLECTLAGNPYISILNADPALGCVLPVGTTPITSNGMPITNGFDLAVYIKGDKKSVAIYNATLEIEYEEEAAVIPVCGAPTWSPITDNAVFVWNDCGTLNWHVRITAGGTLATTYRGNVASEFGFDRLAGVSLETNDVLLPGRNVLNIVGPISYALYLGKTGFDGFDFSVDDEGGVWDGCFTHTSPDVPVLVGATRVEVDGPFSLATYGACTP